MRSYRHGIYGARKQTSAEVACQTLTDIVKRMGGTMMALMATIDAYFPVTFVTTEVIGSVRGMVTMPHTIFVRVTWRQRYPNTYFDLQNVLHRLQIKGIYLENGWDPCVDPLFKDAFGITLL